MDVKMENNVVYKTVGDRSLTADIIYPLAKPSEKSPVWFYIHGGGWHGGSKDEPKAFTSLLTKVLAAGVTLITIEYRLTKEPGAHFPAMADDCADALRDFTENAEHYGIDPENAFVGGASAGGHLALMMAYAAERFGDTANKNLPSLRFVVDLCGPVDMTRDHDNVTGADDVAQLIERFISPGADKEKALLLASPIFYAKQLPAERLIPVIAVHGQEDELVHKSQPHILEALYGEKGREFLLIKVENGSHSFQNIPGLPPASPDVDEIQNRVAAFVLGHI